MVGTLIIILYIEMRPYFVIFACFYQTLIIITVWNTIDDRYSNFVFYIERKPHFLIFTSFEINFIFFSVPLLRSKPIVQCDNDRDRNDMKGSKRH